MKRNLPDQSEVVSWAGCSRSNRTYNKQQWRQVGCKKSHLLRELDEMTEDDCSQQCTARWSQ